MPEKQPNIQGLPTICDVARAVGGSIASVSQVLNGHRNTRLATGDGVLRAVAELGYLPDGAAWALSARLKEVIGGRDAQRIMTTARKCDGLVLHDRVLESSLLAQPPGRCRLSPRPASPPRPRATPPATAALA